MGQNLEQYKDLQGVKEDHFVDREARPHQVRRDVNKGSGGGSSQILYESESRNTMEYKYSITNKCPEFKMYRSIIS